MNVTEIILEHTANEFITEIAIDSKEFCLDKSHFFNYPKQIVYHFNQLGYRDQEWHGDISNGIWCVGDSFTVGLGQPFEEIWPQLVQKKLGQKTFNMSMNGASNDWIARRIQFILDNFEPSLLLVQWSYTHRRENSNTMLSDEARAGHFSKELEMELEYINHLPKTKQLDRITVLDNLDIENCLHNIMSISNEHNVNIIHSFVPEFFNPLTDPQASIYSVLEKHNINFFPAQEQLDFARDGFHYDILTATHYADQYVSKIKTLS